MKRIASKIFILLFLSVQLHAQTVSHGNLNTWFLSSDRVNFSEKWGANLEVHDRMGSFLSDEGILIIRPSVDYYLNKQVELSGGYSFIRTWPYAPYNQPLPRNESNVWEQAILKSTIGKVHISHRFRFEQRFIDKINSVNSIKGKDYYIYGTTFSNRFRYRFIISFDLVKTNKGKSAIFFQGFDELFINQSNNMLPKAFTRNWLYTGLGYRFNKQFNIQLAHMHQYDKTGTNNFVSSSIIQLSVFKTFSLYGNKPKQ